MSMPQRKKQSVKQPTKPTSTATTQRKGRGFRIPKWAWVAMALTSVATVSAGTGALLAVSMTTTPLLQSQLSPEEAAVFSDDNAPGSRF